MVDSNLDGVLRPIVTGWLGKIEQAIKHKKPFTDIAEQCTAFFSASTGFMWESKYLKKFLNTSTSPRFRMTMSKAFELVALFGPTLYWKNPTRTVTPRRQVPLPEHIFGPENMAELQQMEQQLQGQMQQMQQQMQQVQQQQEQIKKLKGDLQTAQRESIHDRKRVEVKEFEKKLAKAEAKAEMATQLYKERASDELKKLREEVKKATSKKVGLK